eukprot:2973153-Prymnesium_polylepis.1
MPRGRSPHLQLSSSSLSMVRLRTFRSACMISPPHSEQRNAGGRAAWSSWCEASWPCPRAPPRSSPTCCEATSIRASGPSLCA